MASNTDTKNEDIQDLIGRCTEKLEEVQASLEDVDEMEKRVNERGHEVQSEIKRTAESMIDTIQMRKCEMTAQVKSAMKAKQKALSLQKNKLASFVDSLKSSIEYSHDILNHNDVGEAEQWKGALIEVLREMNERNLDHEPAANDNFELTVNEEEHVFDLEEFFTRLCTRRRSHLTSNGHLRCWTGLELI